MERSRLPRKRSASLSCGFGDLGNIFTPKRRLRSQHHAPSYLASSPINAPYGSIETFPCSTADVPVASKLTADLKPPLRTPRFTVCVTFDIFSATTTAWFL